MIQSNFIISEQMKVALPEKHIELDIAHQKERAKMQIFKTLSEKFIRIEQTEEKHGTEFKVIFDLDDKFICVLNTLEQLIDEPSILQNQFKVTRLKSMIDTFKKELMI